MTAPGGDGPDEPAPIDVVLVPSDGVGSSAVARPGSEPEPGGRSPRRAPALIVVGVVALAVGWVLGRGGADPAADDAPSVVRSTIEDADPVASIAPAPSASPTVAATTGAPQPAPATPSTTSEPARPSVIETDVDVPPELRGQPIEIVAYGNGRRLFQLDLATARLRSQRVTAQPFGRARILVGSTWSLIPSNDADLSSTIVWDDGRTSPTDLGAADQILGVADGRSVWWTFSNPAPFGGAIVQLRPVQGGFGQVIAGVPVLPSQVDPAGGLLVELPDGWFGVVPRRVVETAGSGGASVADPAVTPITSGRLVGISTEFALVEECGTDLACEVYLDDRGTGERRVVARPEELLGPVPYSLAGTSSVAPGGRHAVVEVLEPADRASTQRSLGVVDLESGEVVDIGPTQDVDQVAWTPDGRFVIFLAGGRVVAHDTESGMLSVIAEELVAIDAFGVRVTDEA